MKIPEPLRDTFERLRAEAVRIAGAVKGHSENKALTELLRPNLGPTPEPLRRMLEPLVAACAVSVLAALLGVGAVSFAALVVVAALAYAILTYVFGLELDVAV